ncbi:prepilin-type N-terminal cleavage/methylation domain-containing protein [Gallaecimonas kandeliae]|uniref:prepilin-type N-terminal cleavage/methylation domain-containing protein n=1 Tax=Gallaecimonas kandeliae TaxID=3029055 RepID=UPI0026496642|nr:prepilin-type N-terminal cleavage/methylation domain-containing protein [Gallaecimonas kandeliae]WKE65670.1 prepilin-type N-terminal cleavage/methylation domain-containing protein [Gallaecimonas kandeliae]
MAAKGFTLLEMMLVLVIAALLVSLVAPRFGALLPSLTLQGEARTTAALLRKLRSDALSQSRPLSLKLSEDGTTLLLPPDLGDRQLPQGITALLGGGLKSLDFFADGTARGGDLLLSSKAGHLRVHLDWLTAEVSIHDQ